MVPQMPENFLRNFLIFTLGVGGTLCYLILKARWHGWMLVGAIFVSMYGISTVASQIDSVAFLAVRLPHGTIRAILVQGAIAAALFAPLACPGAGQVASWLNSRTYVACYSHRSQRRSSCDSPSSSQPSSSCTCSSAITSLGEILNCSGSTGGRSWQPSG